MDEIITSIDLECTGCGAWILAGERCLIDGETGKAFHSDGCLERWDQAEWLRNQRVPPLLARLGRP